MMDAIIADSPDVADDAKSTPKLLAGNPFQRHWYPTEDLHRETGQDQHLSPLVADDISDEDVMEDVLNLLMGLPGQYIQIPLPHDPLSLSPEHFEECIEDPIRVLGALGNRTINVACEALPMALYHSIFYDFIDRYSDFQRGKISHALVSAIRQLWKEYLDVLVECEGKLRGSVEYGIHEFANSLYPLLGSMRVTSWFLLTVVRGELNDVGILNSLWWNLNRFSGDPGTGRLFKYILGFCLEPFQRDIERAASSPVPGTGVVMSLESMPAFLSAGVTERLIRSQEYWATIEKADGRENRQDVLVLAHGNTRGRSRESVERPTERYKNLVHRIEESVSLGYERANNALLDLLGKRFSLSVYMKKLISLSCGFGSDWLETFFDMIGDELCGAVNGINMARVETMLEVVLEKDFSQYIGKVSARTSTTNSVWHFISVFEVALVTDPLPGLLGAPGDPKEGPPGSSTPRSTASAAPLNVTPNDFARRTCSMAWEGLVFDIPIKDPFGIIVDKQASGYLNAFVRLLAFHKYVERTVRMQWIRNRDRHSERERGESCAPVHFAVCSLKEGQENCVDPPRSDLMAVDGENVEPQVQEVSYAAGNQLRAFVCFQMLTLLNAIGSYWTVDVIAPTALAFFAHLETARTISEIQESFAKMRQTLLTGCFLTIPKLLRLYYKLAFTCFKYASRSRIESWQRINGAWRGLTKRFCGQLRFFASERHPKLRTLADRIDMSGFYEAHAHDNRSKVV